MKKRLIFAIWIMLIPTAAWAHPGHGGSGFVSGLAHPFSGLDHILGMLATGIWAARNSGIRRWLIPAAFLGGMLAGGMIGLNGVVPSHLESAVAASVLVSALMVALAVRLPLPIQAGLAVFFALWHGIAHGAELPGMAAPFTYACGFLIATAMLLGCGLMLGNLLRRNERDRWLGAGIATLAASLFWA